MNDEARNPTLVLRDAMNQQRWSMRRWAKDRGYNPNTVIQTVRRWFSRTDRSPEGAITLRILADLQKDFGEAVPTHLSTTHSHEAQP